MTVEVTKLSESAGKIRKATGARRRAKIIAANIWGSTAYYPGDVLERDGTRAFPAGVQMFLNHMSDSERYDRPEGNVQDLVGKTITDAVYDANGEDGPGLYADVEFYESFVPRINEIADDIGLSIHASGITDEGEMEGRYGPIVVGLLAGHRVDVVTKAGAGGKLTSILESDRGLAGRPIELKESEQSRMTDVTKEDFTAFTVKMTELFEGLSTTFKEAFKPAEPIVEAPEGDEPAEAPAEGEKVEPKTELKEAVKIDHAAVLTALRESDLPAVSASAVVAQLLEGKTLEEAVQGQVELREAFAATSAEHGTVVLKESAGAVDPLDRAVQILGR